MYIAALDWSSFISKVNPLTSTFKPTRKPSFVPVHRLTISSCRHSPADQNEDSTTSSSTEKNENRLAKLAVVTLAAGVLALSPINSDPVFAAKSGGRIGGQAFKSAAPRASSPRINNSRTNIYVNPPVAPPLVGGYGYGYGFGVPFYGGWGWSPFSFFAPGPGVAVGVGGGGLEFFFLFLILSAVSAFIRRFLSSRDEDIDDY